jgi:hypothetical protein
MLCYDEGGQLMYCRAAPRAWLEPGNEIRVERLQTRYGPTSFSIQSQEDRISALVSPPARYAPSRTQLRLRTAGRIASVRINGVAAEFDHASGTVELPAKAERVEVEADVVRK